MGILEQITQMRSQGMPEEEIITKLKDQGIAPKEIADAMSQSQIKSAIENNQEEIPMAPEQNQDEYTPSGQGAYNPSVQETENYPQENQEYYQSQPQEYYPQENYGSYAQSSGTDIMIEIAEQVVSEKIKTLQNQLQSANEFKTLAETKINTLGERLKRIETTIDNLQIQILEKVGSYGNTLGNIKKEMSMMQDSFGKMISKKATRKSTHKKHSKK